jgi:hypothetical protein
MHVRDSQHTMQQDKRTSGIAGTLPAHSANGVDPLQMKDKSVPLQQPSSAYEVPASEVQRLREQRIAPSYATAAYREFLSQSNNASAAASRSHSRRSSVSSISGSGGGMDSVFGSVQSSSMSSMAPSGATTQQHSRSTSPSTASSHAVREGTIQLQQQQQQHHHPLPADSHAYSVLQSTNVSHVPGAAVHVAGQGQLSMASLKPRLPEDDEDSDDSSNVDRSVRLPARAVLRPRHFTFAEADVLKSLKRAQERERERERRQAHEREVEQQRTHEAALHAAREQERERQRALELAQHQREQTARDIAYKLSLQRQELDRQRRLEARAGDHFSSSSTSEEASSGDNNSASSSPSSSLRPGERAHSPRPPSHFRFDTHDIRKSYSKPSQRQAIGHWSTFPRSSTVMYATHQLKALIAHRQQEGEAKLQSAPASPHRMHMHDSHASLMHHHQASRHHHHMGGTESSYTSLEDVNRRASMPTASASSSSLQRTSVVAAAPMAGSSLVPPVAAGNHHVSSSNHSKHTLPASHLPPLESRPAVPAPAPAAAFATPDRSTMDIRATRANHSRSITLGSLPLEKLRAHATAFDKSMEWSSSSSAYQKQYPSHTHLPAHEQNSRIRRLERMGAHVRGASAGSMLERPSAAAVRSRFSEMNAASGGGAAAGGALHHPVKAVPMHAPAQHLSNTGATVDAHAARHQPNQNQHVSRQASSSSSSSYSTSNSAPSSPQSRQVARMTGARSRLQQHHHQVTSGSVRSGSAGSSGSPGSLLARRSIQYASSGNESKSASANSSPVMPTRSRFAGAGAFSSGLLTGDFTLPLLTHDKLAPSASSSAAAGPDGWNTNHHPQHKPSSSYVHGTAYAVRH